MRFDYSSVTPESVRETVRVAIAECDALVEGVETARSHTWDTTMGPLDAIDAITTRAYGEGPFLSRAHPDADVRIAAQEAEQEITAWQSDLVFRGDLYESVRAFAATDEAAGLDGERARLLAFTLRDFRRAGHELDAERREELQAMRRRLAELGIAFQRNLDEDRSGLDLRTDEFDGLPETYVSALGDGAEAGTKHVSLDYPDYFPFMDLALDRDARRRLQFAYYTRVVAENRPILEEAVALRRRIAGVFGLDSWAAYAMEEKMAKHPGNVEAFFADLEPGLQAGAEPELADLRDALGHDDLQAWDQRHLHAAIKRERFGIDQMEVADYFPLDEVLAGLLAITGEVFGLAYRRLDDATTWHPDVTAWAIDDAATGTHLADFFLDLHPREAKYGHAAAFRLVAGHRADSGYVNPVTAILANFTKPTHDAPSLLKHEEVVTFFHEFGHVLHNSLGRTELVRFTGINTEWDFVEAPSQIMEHWCWDPDVLRRFARHHRTGEPIPEDLVERLVAARDLHQSLFWLRQVSFGQLDLRLHGTEDDSDLDRINRETSELSGLPFHEGTFYPAGFAHLFGYDAGYYGYLWSKVYGDDMFSRFAAEGVLSPEVGAAYRRAVLEPGGSRDAMDLLRDFLDREPNQDAFLANLGIG
ncbi:MAG TPA: M3 family metallopeptidase [Acidimicrobiia bacterium]|nr:M3 family metallopeptidase [Acidimicrobiia bacterium]